MNEEAEKPDDHIAKLTTDLQALTLRQNRRLRRMFWAEMFADVCMVSLPLHTSLVANKAQYIIVYLCGYFCRLSQKALRSKWKKVASEHAKTADIREIGAYVDALQLPYQRDMVDVVVLEMVKRIGPPDAKYLTEAHRQILRRYLSYWCAFVLNKKFVLQIIRTFEVIKDTKSLPTIERLADGHGVARKNPEIRGAARQCANTLKEKFAEEQNADTLLRASEVFNQPGIALLRPAAYTPNAEPEQLVRAASGEGPAI